MISDCLIQTDKYCQFTIRVAGLDIAINTSMISGLQTVLLGQEWIQSVNLLSGSGCQSYYIPIPLAVEAARERFPDVGDSKAETAIVGEISEEYDDSECINVDCSDNYSSDSRLSSSKLSSDDEHSLDDNPSGDELSLDDGHLSDDEISSSEELIFEYELAPTHESEEDDEFYKDYKDFDECDKYDECDESDGYSKCNECDECDKYDEYDKCDEYGKCEYDKCECDKCECEKCEERQECQEGEVDTDTNLQGFIKHEHLEHYAEAEQTKAPHEVANLEREQKHHQLTYLKNSLDRNNEPVGDPESNIGSQLLEPKWGRVFPSSYHMDSLKQSAVPSSTKSQMNRDQTLITKHQAKEIVNALRHISRTQAGQSFRAPVGQLWPECADVYAAKVPNPIDLGTMEMKVKNNIYPSLDDFRADAILLYENCLAFNGINHIITSAALEVRDTILKAISDMGKGKGCTIFRASTRNL